MLSILILCNFKDPLLSIDPNLKLSLFRERGQNLNILFVQKSEFRIFLRLVRNFSLIKLDLISFDSFNERINEEQRKSIKKEICE